MTLYGCEIWIEGDQCGACKEGMILNTRGNCNWIKDLNCLVENEDGICIRCISLMYYNME